MPVQGEVRQLEGELAQSQQRVQELEAELGGAREAAAAAQRRVGVLEAEVTFYAGQAEQAGQELDGMQRVTPTFLRLWAPPAKAMQGSCRALCGNHGFVPVQRQSQVTGASRLGFHVHRHQRHCQLSPVDSPNVWTVCTYSLRMVYAIYRLDSVCIG